MYNNKRTLIYLAEVIVGAALIFLAFTGRLDGEIWGGIGGGLMGIGIARTAMSVKYNRDPEYREKVDIDASDERNHMIRNKAWAWTGYATVMIAAIGEIAALIMGKRMLMNACAIIVCGILVLYWGCYVIISRRY
ncbi:MAG: hypothetical protein II971_07300 [Firmicutes bacterium]|nr:hypothetical protein [Bacillota bacterium]